MPQTAPSDTATAAIEPPRRGDFKRSFASAALGGVVALAVAVVALGGSDGERADHPTVPAASQPTWRHGEAMLPAAWLLDPRRESRRPKRAVAQPVAASPPAPAESAPVVPASAAPVAASPSALPQPAQPGEDFTWQR